MSRTKHVVMVVRHFCMHWHFVNWISLSLGIHIDLYGPFVEIHLPFGFVRIGWAYFKFDKDGMGGGTGGIPCDKVNRIGNEIRIANGLEPIP